MATRLNYRQGVREKCFDCFYDDSEPGTRLQQVSACPAFECPLRDVRPVTDSRWPMALVDSITETLGMTREEVLAWADNPRVKSNLPVDFRHGTALPRAAHCTRRRGTGQPLYIPTRGRAVLYP